jgi:uncharacterized protein (DUF2342 family)
VGERERTGPPAVARTAARSDLRRKALGAQIGALLGYVSRKVLGQYDAFLPPDDDGLLYFVGPNLVEVERRFELPRRDFRLWVSIHEVTHRVQFGATPWLRPHLEGLIGRYVQTVQVDSREVVAQVRRAVDAVRSGADWRGMNGILLMMSDRRRSRGGVEKVFQQAIGFESKVQQYASGERFVREVVAKAGMEGFNRVWQDEANLPTPEEIADPGRWVGRVVNG